MIIETMLFVIGMLCASALAFSTVKDWLRSHQSNQNDIGVLVKKALNSNEYEIIGNVFSATGTRRATTRWRTTALDSELTGLFKNRDRVEIKI